mmetsp:Transcript_40726/g.105706  ORF Transcript_40726/g.105706 Transcript_40726/m.105706 type:complete len:764 (-) Transcript_40726:211-2502(-)
MVPAVVNGGMDDPFPKFHRCLSMFVQHEGRSSFDDERKWMEACFIPYLSSSPHSERLVKNIALLLAACRYMVKSVGRYGRWQRPPSTRDLYLRTCLLALSRPEMEPLTDPQLEKTDIADLFTNMAYATAGRTLLFEVVWIILDDHSVRLGQAHNLTSASLAADCSPSRRRTDHLPTDLVALACSVAHFRIPSLSPLVVQSFGCNIRDLPLHLQDGARQALSLDVNDIPSRQSVVSTPKLDGEGGHRMGRTRSCGVISEDEDGSEDMRSAAAATAGQFRLYTDKTYLLRLLVLNGAQMQGSMNADILGKMEKIARNGFLWGCLRTDFQTQMQFLDLLLKQVESLIEWGRSPHMENARKRMQIEADTEKDVSPMARRSSRSSSTSSGGHEKEGTNRRQSQGRNRILSALSGAKQAIVNAVERRRRESKETVPTVCLQPPSAGEFDRFPGGANFMFYFFKRMIKATPGQLLRLKEPSLKMISSSLRGGGSIPMEIVRENRDKKLYVAHGNPLLGFLVKLLLRRTNAHDAEQVVRMLQTLELWFAELRTGVSRMIDCTELFEAIAILLQSERLKILNATLNFLYRTLQTFEGIDRRKIILEVIMQKSFFRLFLHWDADVRRLFHYILIFRCPSPLKCVTVVGEEKQQEEGLFCLVRSEDMPVYRALVHLDPDLDTVVKSRIKGYIEVVCNQTRGGESTHVGFEAGWERWAPASITGYYNVLSDFETWRTQQIKGIRESLNQPGRMPPPFRVIYPDVKTVGIESRVQA